MSEALGYGTRPRNRLLGALPPEELARLRPHLERVLLEPRDVLFEPHAPISHVYFPETAVITLFTRLGDGVTMDVGTAGYEGMAGLPSSLSDDTSSYQAFVSIPGIATRMKARTFAELSSAPGALLEILRRYTQAFTMQVAHAAACNGAHRVEARCARWLLMTDDRTGGRLFPLTEEVLAVLLRATRYEVMTAMSRLQDAKLVRESRGMVGIMNRSRLEEASCECYRTVGAHFEQLMSRAA